MQIGLIDEPLEGAIAGGDRFISPLYDYLSINQSIYLYLYLSIYQYIHTYLCSV